MINKIIQLEGKTKKGKERIKRDGPFWKIIRASNKIFFSSENGPWLLVQSEENLNVSRWVKQNNDFDFIVKG